MKRNLVKTWRAEGGCTRLRELRNARGLTLDELAHKAGVSKGTLSKLENPTLRPNPSLDMIEAIAGALGVKREELLEGGSLQPSQLETSATERSLELYLREIKPRAGDAKRFKRVAMHATPPETVPHWRQFTEWLALFTGRDPQRLDKRDESNARIRSFKRSPG